MSLWRGRIFSYLAAYMLGLVCHIGESGVAGNKLRSSCMPDFLAALVLLPPCPRYQSVSWSFQDILAQSPPQGASKQINKQATLGKIVPFQDILLKNKNKLGYVVSILKYIKIS